MRSGFVMTLGMDWGVKVVLLAGTACLASPAHGAPFTPGNLVVYRTSTSTLTSATAVFVDEYTFAGELVQTINMPVTVDGVHRRLTGAASDQEQGFLNRSVDGRYILIPGYDAPVGTANVTAISGIERVVGRIGANGVVDTSTTFSTAFDGTIFRSVASTDGTSIWATGGSPLNGQIRYTTFGTVGTGTQTNLSIVPTHRALEIYNGQLYSTTGTTYAISAIGSGTPTNSNNDVTSIVSIGGLGGNGFFMADLDQGVVGLDTAWVEISSSGRRIAKYSLVGSSWVLNNSIASGNTANLGLTGVVTPDGVQLFTTSDGTRIRSLLDTGGYNAPISGTLTPIALAPSGFAFRGIDFTPVPEPTSVIMFGGLALCGLLKRRRQVSR